MSSSISSQQPFLTHNVFLPVQEIFFFLRQSIIFASDCVVVRCVALGKQCKRWAAAGLLDQPFNPVTLSLRQTACYRSFHYVFKQQIALQVRCPGRAKKKKSSHVQRFYNQPVITLLLSDVQISEDSWKTGERVSVIGDNVGKRCDCPLVKKLCL